jgi:hypothetical protein
VEDIPLERYEKEWEQPLGLPAVGELTARWLEGKGWSPWQCGSPPDEETDSLIPALAEMNRLGYVTNFSQPGDSDTYGRQRAAVEGYCAYPQAECLAALTLRTDLVVITHYPGSRFTTYEMPITEVPCVRDGVEGWRTHTKLAGAAPPDQEWEGIHPRTVLELEQCYVLAIFDPQWGRNDVLWPAILQALHTDPAGCVGSLLTSGWPDED